MVGIASKAKINFRPRKPPKYCSIWSYDTSISLFDYVVSVISRYLLYHYLFSNAEGGRRIAPHPVMPLKSPSRIGLSSKFKLVFTLAVNNRIDVFLCKQKSYTEQITNLLVRLCILMIIHYRTGFKTVRRFFL